MYTVIMPVTTDDFSMFRSQRIVTLVIHRDLYDDRRIERVANTLKTYIKSKDSSVKLLIDLRRCKEFNTSHVLKVVGMLVAEHELFTSTIDASAILLTMTDTLSLIRSLFHKTYTLRGFDIFGSESEAYSFLDPKPDDSQ